MKSIYRNPFLIPLLLVGAAAVIVMFGDPALAAILPVFAGTAEHLKSQQITNATAVPSVLNPAHQTDGRLRVKRGVITSVLAAPDAGSTYRVFRVKSNDMVKDLRIDSASFGTGAAFDIGLYRTNEDGGAAVDVDFFCSALVIAAAVADTQILRESTVIGVTNMDKRIWEILTLTQDPGIEYDVVMTVTTAPTQAASCCLTAEVVSGFQ